MFLLVVVNFVEGAVVATETVVRFAVFVVAEVDAANVVVGPIKTTGSVAVCKGLVVVVRAVEVITTSVLGFGPMNTMSVPLSVVVTIDELSKGVVLFVLGVDVLVIVDWETDELGNAVVLDVDSLPCSCLVVGSVEGCDVISLVALSLSSIVSLVDDVTHNVELVTFICVNAASVVGRLVVGCAVGVVSGAFPVLCGTAVVVETLARVLATVDRSVCGPSEGDHSSVLNESSFNVVAERKSME